jgi:signal transduction histidine kinase
MISRQWIQFNKRLVLYGFRSAATRYGLSVLCFLILFHSLLTAIRVGGIERDLRRGAAANSAKIWRSLRDRDFSSLEESLLMVLGKDTDWMSFESPALGKFTVNPLLVGRVDFNSPIQRTGKIVVQDEGAVFGTINYHFNLAELTMNLARENFLLYTFAAFFIFGLIAYVQGGIVTQLIRLERDLMRIADLPNRDTSIEHEIQVLSETRRKQDYHWALIRILRSLRQVIDAESELRRLEATATLARQVAHDIRSPLSALDLLLSGRLDLTDERRSVALSAIARVKDIATDLLNMGKIQVRQTHAIALNSTVESAFAEKKAQLSSRPDVELALKISGTPDLQAIGDQRELNRMLSNLIDNAVEALPGGRGRVDVELNEDEGFVVCAIRDNGRGIPPHILPQLGQKGLTHGKPGYGLGLYHARTTVESWTGRLELQSQENAGTTVKLFLPKNRPA